MQLNKWNETGHGGDFFYFWYNILFDQYGKVRNREIGGVGVTCIVYK